MKYQILLCILQFIVLVATCYDIGYTRSIEIRLCKLERKTEDLKRMRGMIENDKSRNEKD